jgi:hypothetical protein
MSTLVQVARALPLVRALALLPLALEVPMALIAPLVWPSQAQAVGEDEEPTYDYGAKVKIELRMEDGTEVTHRGEMRSFGNEWRFEFEGGEHSHLVTLNAEGKEGDKQLKVTLAYDRDGMAIIAPFKADFPVRKRQSFWTDTGKIAIALTFTPTKFEREDKSRDDKDKIDPGDDDSPLGGDLFK